MQPMQDTASGTILYLGSVAGPKSRTDSVIEDAPQAPTMRVVAVPDQPASASAAALEDDAAEVALVEEDGGMAEGSEAPEDPDAVTDQQLDPLDAEEGVDVPVDDGPYSKAEYKRMKKLLKKRVSPSRFKHSANVAKTARIMAKAYGVDPDMARMAGLLHDWDKCLSVEELHDRVDQFGLDVSEEMLNDMPWLLHGPTGAAALAHEHPQFDHAVYQAIGRHTLGARNMSKLDMIVFVADKIEPGHPVPAYQALYNRIGRMDLFDLFFAVQRENLSYLIDAGRPLNPEAVAVWNHCVKLRS